MLSTKTPVVNRVDYTMYLEWYGDMLWFHTDVRKWDRKTKVKFLEDLYFVQYLAGMPLLALVEEDNTKLAKFGRLTGWEMFDKIQLNNGKVGHIYKRSL